MVNKFIWSIQYYNESTNWFRSYLTNRYQYTKIGGSLSSKIKLNSGVPQGGILSPLVYIIYVADLELWLKHSTALFDEFFGTGLMPRPAREDHFSSRMEYWSQFKTIFLIENFLITF